MSSSTQWLEKILTMTQFLQKLIKSFLTCANVCLLSTNSWLGRTGMARQWFFLCCLVISIACSRASLPWKSVVELDFRKLDNLERNSRVVDSFMEGKYFHREEK